MESDIYFSTLQSLRAHANKLQKKDELEEKRLIEYLPVNEKIEIERENKVLTKWQERQRDWEKIEQRISKKISSKIVRPLMMTVTDEYRSKMEEYDLIQAAIPLKDRYADSSWQMTLRGGGPITVAIGHIFSGLECEIDPHFPKPKMVRKPKPATAVLKNDTFLEESENLTMKRKKYEKSIREIRPHTMTYRDAGNLVIRSTDLFQWAEESSLEYVNRRKDEELARLEEEMEALRSLEASQTQEEEVTLPDHPQVTFLSPPDVVMDTQIKKRVHKTVAFKNTGPVVLYYRWKKLSQASKPKSKDKNASNPKSLDAIMDEKGDSDPEIRAHVLDKKRDKFFCLADCGEILPDEVISTEFVFDSDVGGVYRSNWILQFVPEETKITIADSGEMDLEKHGAGVHFADDRSEKAGSVVSNSHSKPVTGSLGITLRGHCIVPDESMTNRHILSSHISYQTEVTEIQDIIYALVRRVRDPVRMKDLFARQRDLFAARNDSVYHSFFPQASKHILAPWKITNERIDRLEELHHNVHHLFDKIQQQFQSTWEAVSLYENADILAAVPTPSLPEMLQWEDNTLLTETERETLLLALFPEQTIDIFDEVTADDITPRWNYNVATALSTLNNLAVATEFLANLEGILLLRAKKEAKLQSKLARKAAKKAAGDSDDDEDDDEEEEEDDEEDEDAKRKQRKPQHPLAIDVQQLKDAIEGELLALQITLTYDKDTVFSLTRDALCHAIDSICDAQQHALQAANLMELVNHSLGPAQNTSDGFTGFVNASVISPMQNPFLTEEGALAFEKMLALTSPDPPVDPHAPPAKGKKEAPKKGKEVAPPPATPLQVDYYHKVFYEQVRERIIDHVIDTVDIRPSEVSLGSASSEPANLVSKLTESAVWRPDDITHKVIFYTFDLAQRTDTSDGCSVSKEGIGFDAIGRKIATVAEEVTSMILSGQPTCVLLLSSSSCASDPDNDNKEQVWQARAGELAQRLQYHWEKHVLQYRKAMKRSKQSIPSDHISQRTLQITNHIDSWATLMYDLLPPVLSTPTTATGAVDGTPFIPIFIVPDLTLPRLVPAVPVYEEEEDDDDDPAVPIGLEASRSLHHRQHLAAYPVRVSVDKTHSKLGGRQRSHLTRRASVRRQLNDPPNCFCDISAALVDLTQYIAVQFFQNNPQAVQWIDGTTQHVFQPQLPLYKVHDASYKKIMPRDPVQLAMLKLPPQSVLCSQRVREAFLWATLPRFLIPAWSSFFLREDDDDPSGGDSDDTVSSASLALKAHVRHLFPVAIAERRRPRTIFVLGGAMRAEKLRLLDELIPLFPTIYLVGEVAVRFLKIETVDSTSSSSSSSHINERASRFQTTCRRLLAKARVMGCELILPTDFVVGDESQDLSAVHVKLFHHDASFLGVSPPPLPNAGKPGMEESKAVSRATQPETSVAGLTRSDPVEYDGDTKVVSVTDLLSLSQPLALPSLEEALAQEKEEVAAKNKKQQQQQQKKTQNVSVATPEAVYDIGPASQQRLKDAIENSELVYIYGTAGYVELSAFQGGHNAVVQAIAGIFTKETAAAEARKAQRKEAAKLAGKGNVVATQMAYAAMQPTWLERHQHVVLWGEETVDWVARALDPDADFSGDLVASGHVSFAEANAALLLGCLVATEPAVNSKSDVFGLADCDRRQVHALLEDTLMHRTPLETEFVYSRARNLDDDEEDEEDEDEEEDEDD